MRRDQRRVLAICAALLWLAGVEVLPNVHLATHDGEHTHAIDGAIVRVTYDHVHQHANGSVHGRAKLELAKPRRRIRRIEQLAIGDPSSHHDAAGLAHHATALHRPAPPLLAPLHVDQPTIAIEHAPDGVVTVAAIDRANARGPPQT